MRMNICLEWLSLSQQVSCFTITTMSRREKERKRSRMKQERKREVMEFSHSGMDDDEMQPTSNWKQEERASCSFSSFFHPHFDLSFSLSLSCFSLRFCTSHFSPSPFILECGRKNSKQERERGELERERERRVREFER